MSFQKKNIIPQYDSQCPAVDDVVNFMQKKDPYHLVPSCSAFSYWHTIMSDSPLSPLGEVMASLPASQACVERIFSSAGWQATDRENLSSQNLAREV